MRSLNLNLGVNNVAPYWRPVGRACRRRRIPGENCANFGQILDEAELFFWADLQSHRIFEWLRAGCVEDVDRPQSLILPGCTSIAGKIKPHVLFRSRCANVARVAAVLSDIDRSAEMLELRVVPDAPNALIGCVL